MKIIKSAHRYLLYELAVALKWFVCFLPRPLILYFGRICGCLCFYVLSKERKRAIRHLNMAFGHNKDNYNIAKKAFINLGMNLFEWLQMPCLSTEKINRIIGKIDGLERINDTLEKKKGAIMLTSHFGNWEYFAGYFGLNGYKGAVIGREIYYPPYNKILVGLRNSVGVGTIYRDGSIRKILEVLKKNTLLGVLPDQDTDKVEGVFVNFFGKAAYTPTGPVALSLVSGAPIIPCFIVREGKRFHIYIEKPLELTITEDREETLKINTQKWSDVCEKYIRKYPDHWVWMHRRWKTKNGK